MGCCLWIFVSLTGGFRLFGVLLILVVLVVLARGLHPVSFPNLEVKPFCADGTATGGLWESRALPTVSLSEWTGECWPVCGLVFPGLLFWWWGCLVLFWGRHPHHLFLFVVCLGGVGSPPVFYVFMGCLLLKVVKDTPAVRRQTSLS